MSKESSAPEKQIKIENVKIEGKTDKGVYALISAVMGEMAKDGISKTSKNAAQGYMFRGIDDVYNALAPIMARHGLVVLPRFTSREVTERAGQKGNAIFSVVLDAEFDFISAHDQSKHTVRVYGEAMDSGDKATNKAMSAAYKYACIQTFCIPTEGDNDADATTHEVAAKPAPAKVEKTPEQKQREMAQWVDDLCAALTAAKTQTDYDNALPPKVLSAFDRLPEELRVRVNAAMVTATERLKAAAENMEDNLPTGWTP